MSKLKDLLFIIGLFLSLIGAIVLSTYFLGGSDSVQGVHVNLLGGGSLLGVGLSMLGGSLISKTENNQTKMS